VSRWTLLGGFWQPHPRILTAIQPVLTLLLAFVRLVMGISGTVLTDSGLFLFVPKLVAAADVVAPVLQPFVQVALHHSLR
jgi:hypothetical protein